jgi:hypothetical protein
MIPRTYKISTAVSYQAKNVLDLIISNQSSKKNQCAESAENPPWQAPFTTLKWDQRHHAFQLCDDPG